jgi:electron transport complex protein RnfC
MKKSFKGGAHPQDFKEMSKQKAIITLAPPDKVIIPLSQHIGAPCTPIVSVGDYVKMGQKIGDSSSAISAPFIQVYPERCLKLSHVQTLTVLMKCLL